METKSAIRKYAEGVAWEHFYYEDDIPWEPFEDYSEEWLEEQCQMLANAVEKAMLWAKQTY